LWNLKVCGVTGISMLLVSANLFLFPGSSWCRPGLTGRSGKYNTGRFNKTVESCKAESRPYRRVEVGFGGAERGSEEC